MSGAETMVSLTVGVLPLLIAAAEHYDQCFRPFVRYKKIAKEADHFRNQLNIQKTIFRNQCRLLLEQIVERDAASCMLKAPEDPSWHDAALDAKLSQLLGESREACVATIEIIEQRLRHIQSECQELWTALDAECQKKEDSAEKNAWRRRTAKKLRFAFSKPRLDHTLDDLRASNHDFQVLSKQNLESDSMRARRLTEAPRNLSVEMERYRVIGQASQQLYEALGRACTKHTEHQAHFCVEVEQAIIDGNRGAQVKFNIAFTHVSLAESADQGELTWFVVDSFTGDALTVGHVEKPSNIDFELEKSLKRQILDPPFQPANSRKRVRFQSPEPQRTLMPALPAVPTDSLCSDYARKDFCDLIKRRLRQPSQQSKCVAVLENTERSKNFVYSAADVTCSERRRAVSLERLITKMNEQGASRRLPLYERLRLAKTLAVAVLQFHSTPWLRTSWRSEDVYFFREEVIILQERPILSSPHVNVRFRDPDGPLSQSSTFPSHTLARNPLLFSLGVVLLEIAYSSTLESLQQPNDLNDSQKNLYTEFFMARRLASSGRSDMGGSYHKIVERLVECDFGCGNDLSDRQLQVALYKDVICPLERLEQKLHDFHLDT